MAYVAPCPVRFDLRVLGVGEETSLGDVTLPVPVLVMGSTAHMHGCEWKAVL